MNLVPGNKLGSYQILTAIGAGGMGEVYRARDTKLDREVALKILPASFAADPDRLMRFEREAKTLASLNHPNIAAIYGIEETGDTRALVMELVEGEDLSDRLTRGPIPLDEALPIARQVAEALEAAHEAGIIHRDLKPANIKVRGDGTVKVLDFGLAKALDPLASYSPDAANSPTMTSPALTQMGVILGTAAYMAPEQARGRPVDKRADIWAFGVVLFEMLTGKRAFQGDDVSTTLASVLRDDVAWDALPPRTPRPLRRLLRRCLERDPRLRLRDIGDGRLELLEKGPIQEAREKDSESGLHSRRTLLLLSLALVVAALGVGYLVGRRSGSDAQSKADRQSVRFEISPPQGLTFFSPDIKKGMVAIAPDDRAIAFVAANGESRSVYIRYLDRWKSTMDQSVVPEARLIEGTEDGVGPFFSPDGQWLGLFARGQLMKVSLADGTIVKITPVEDSTGACWTPDGTIVFAPGYSTGLVAVSANGGPVREVTTRDADRGEAGHVWPDVLPDGEHILYTIESTGRPFDEARIAVVSLRTGVSKIVLEGGTSARYSPSGHLIYARSNRLLAVPFDLTSLEVTGEVTTVVDGVSAEVGRGGASYSVSRNGSIVFLPGILETYARDLVWAERDGTLKAASAVRRAFSTLSLTTDGQRALAQIQGSDDDIWMLDLNKDSATRLTFGNENNFPAWAPDGERFVLISAREGPFNMYLSSVSEPGKAERIAPSAQNQTSPSWSPDGESLVYEQRSSETGADIWTVPVLGPRNPRALINTRFNEMSPSLSPDGRWLASISDESGRVEVYVQAFPGPLPRAGTNFGAELELPVTLRWSRDGRELFYRDGDRLMSVAIGTGSGLDIGRPRLLFELTRVDDFDVAPDGRFLLDRSGEREPQTRMIVALGGAWEIGRRGR